MIINVITIIISIVALFFSFMANFSSAKIFIKIGNPLGLLPSIIEGKDIVPSLVLPLTFSNNGAKIGRIKALALEIIYPNGTRDVFQGIREIKSIKDIVKKEKNDDEFQAIVENVFYEISVLGKTINNKNILFIPLNSKKNNFPDNFKNAQIILWGLQDEKNKWSKFDNTELWLEENGLYKYKAKERKITETMNIRNDFQKLIKIIK